MSTRRLTAGILAGLLVSTLLGPPAGAQQPEYAWAPLGQINPPARMVPGEKLVLMAAVRNTGTATWFADAFSEEAAVRLGAGQPRDRASAFASHDPTWLRDFTRVRMATPVVGPGQAGLFVFTFTAPVTSGDYEEAFAPVAEDTAWMDDDHIVFRTRVEPIGGVPPIPNPPLPSPPPVPTPGPTPEPTPTPAPLPTPDLPPTPDPSDPPPVEPGAGVRPSDVLPVAFAYDYRPEKTLGAGGTAPGELIEPSALAVDPVGRLVVADTANHRIQRMSTEGLVTQVWGARGAGAGQLDRPSGVAVSAAGHVYVADTGNHRIQVFALTGDHLLTFGGAGTGPGQLDSPAGIAIAPNGDIVVADTGNDRVQVFSPGGGFKTIVGDGGDLSSPHGLAVYDDLIWVADTGNHRVRRFTLDGDHVGTFGAQGTGAGRLTAPRGIAVGAWGVYVADTGSDRIQHFLRTGMFLSSWGTSGTAPGQMLGPWGSALDGSGGLWVAEAGGDRLHLFRPQVRFGPIL